MLRIFSFLVVLFYLLVEIIASVAFADAFGIFGLFLEVVVTLIVGISLLLNFRGIIMHSLYVLYSGKIDKASVAVVTLMQLLGSIFLIIPGVVSDILGVILIIFGFLKVGFVFPMHRVSASSNSDVKIDHEYHDSDFQHAPDDDIIDVEVISKRRQI